MAKIRGYEDPGPFPSFAIELYPDSPHPKLPTCELASSLCPWGSLDDKQRE